MHCALDVCIWLTIFNLAQNMCILKTKCAIKYYALIWLVHMHATSCPSCLLHRCPRHALNYTCVTSGP